MAKHADEDREYLRAGFGRLHERLDKQNDELASIRFAVETGAKIDAQVRSELDGVKKDIQPLISRERMFRWALGTVAGAASAAGISVAVAAESVRAAFRAWLGL